MKKLLLIFLIILSSVAFSEEMTKLNDSNVKNFTGFGIYYYSNGEKYEGQWLNGKRNGVGTYVWNNEDTYSGDWTLEKRTGKGIFTWANGNKYEGDFIDSVRNGKGKYLPNPKNFKVETDYYGNKKETINIISYEGDYVNNYWTGYGVAEYSNGDKYEGEWLNDVREGKGIYTYKNGDKVQGIWVYGKLDGKVKKTSLGKIYEATYENDTMQGNWILSSETAKIESIGSFDLKKYFKKNFNTRDIKEELFANNNEKIDGVNLINSLDGKFLYFISSNSRSDRTWIELQIQVYEKKSGNIIKNIFPYAGSSEIEKLNIYITKTNKLIVPLGRSIKIYNFKDYTLEKEIELNRGIQSVSYNNDETKIIVKDNNTYAIVDIDTGITEKTVNGRFNDVIFSEDGKNIIEYTDNGFSESEKNLTWKNIETDKILKIVKVNSGKFSNDKRYFIEKFNLNKNVYDLAIGNIVQTSDFDFNRNFKTMENLIVLWSGKKLEIIDFINNKIIYSNKFSKNIGGIDISEDKTTLFVYLNNKIIKLMVKDIKPALLVDKSEVYSNGIKKGFLPKGTVINPTHLSFDSDISFIKPYEGSVNNKNLEFMNGINDNVKLYTLSNTVIYTNPYDNKVIGNLPQNYMFQNPYYLKSSDMVYLDENGIKGFVKKEDVAILEKENKTYVVKNNSTYSYKNTNKETKERYSSGDFVVADYVSVNQEFFYSEKLGWFNKAELAIFDNKEAGKRIFIKNDKEKMYFDFTGDTFKIVPIAKEFKILGESNNFYYLENKETKEKYWSKQDVLSVEKPDINDPVLLITKDTLDETVLNIEGKIYDDTEITKLVINGDVVHLEKLNNFDKISYVPEVGYSYNHTIVLIDGEDNNISIEVTDKYNKKTAKILKYSPELTQLNLNEFKLGEVIKAIPDLDYTIALEDNNKDGILTGGSEKLKLTVNIKNKGEGPAKNVILKLSGSDKVTYLKEYKVGTIESNQEKIAVVEFAAPEGVESNKLVFDLELVEDNGFNASPSKFAFNVEPNWLPNIQILDYAIKADGDKVQKNKPFTLYVAITNTGKAEAKNVILEVKNNQEGVYATDDNLINVPSLKVDEVIKMEIPFIVNNKYKSEEDVKFNIVAKEATLRSSAIKDIAIGINKFVPTIKEFELAIKETEKKNIKPTEIVRISDVDIFINEAIPKNPNPKKWAVVIGVENYKKAPYVEFAERDALVTKEYFNKLLGVPTENTFYLSNSDATYGELKVLLKDKLKNRVVKDDEVYFYFSGHGVPTNDGESYLLLNDSDPSNPKISAYAIKELYEDLGSLKTTKSYAFLDTCFSGGTGRTGITETLLEGIRSGVMKVNDISLAFNNLVIFTATDKNQLSNSYKGQNHGLFTYYMLKGLGGEADKDNDKNVSLEELDNYVKDNVSRESRKLGETKVQDPLLKTTVNTNDVIY